MQVSKKWCYPKSVLKPMVTGLTSRKPRKPPGPTLDLTLSTFSVPDIVHQLRPHRQFWRLAEGESLNINLRALILVRSPQNPPQKVSMFTSLFWLVRFCLLRNTCKAIWWLRSWELCELEQTHQAQSISVHDDWTQPSISIQQKHDV